MSVMLHTDRQPNASSIGAASAKSQIRGKRRLWSWPVAASKFMRAAFGFVPITLFGLPVVAASILYFVGTTYWKLPEDRVAQALAGCGLFLAGVAMVLVFLTGLWLRLWTCRARRQDISNLVCGVPYRTGFHLGRAHWNPLLKIDLAWEIPEDVTVRTVSSRGLLAEEVTAGSRAWCNPGKVVRRVTIRDVLGLARVTFRFRQSTGPVRIMPERVPIEELAMLAQHTPGEGAGHPEGKPEGDFMETREYGPGDPLKLVLWKQFARTGRMMVRLPERSIARSDKVLAYLVAGAADEPAAGIARSLLETGRLGRSFLFGADGSQNMADAVPDALEQVVRSVNFRTASSGGAGQGLASFLERGKARGIAVCIVFVPFQPGAWLSTVVRAIRSFAGPCHVVIGVDETTVARPEKRLRRLLFHGGSGVDGHAGLCEVVSRFQKVARVTVVNRTTGKAVAIKE